MIELEVHPAADIFPLMSDEDLHVLANDISEHGLLEPIALLEGKILDGRNRYLVCRERGIEPKTTDAVLGSMTAVEYVLSKNLHRRHLTTAQRAVLAVELLPTFVEQAAIRRRWLGKKSALELTEEMGERGQAAEKAAEIVGLGKSTVEKTAAIKKRDPKVIEEMWSGKIKTVDAARRAAGMLPGDHSSISEDLPRVYYGKGDKWREATQPILRYLKAWENRGYEFRHLNPAEARRRVRIIQEIIDRLNAASSDLEQRSVKAYTSMAGRE